MKTTFTLVLAFFYLKASFAQCYGGTDFATAELFDQGWIYACNTGTSCNSGVIMLNNLSSCDVNTAMDPCVPTPSCGTVSNMGSDLWFKFWGGSTSTATISVTRNMSLGVGIQAFSVPSNNYTPTCSQLTEIGCVADNSQSGNIQLNLTSLTPGNLYFFRVYGIGNPAIHRTGNFCFCGSTGLTEVSLPVRRNSSTASPSGNSKTSTTGFRIKQDNANHRIIIYSNTNTEAEMYTIAGNKLITYHLAKGNNSFYQEFKSGMYIIRKKDTGETQKLIFY
jgi:hypothetical protein